jgi:hypothetical protein
MSTKEYTEKKCHFTEPKNIFVGSTKPKNGFALCKELETLEKAS